MSRGEVPTFPVMVVIGLTVFGLAFVVSEGGIDLSGEKKAKRIVYSSQSFGQVGSASQDFRIARFGDFNVGELRGDVQAHTARKATVSNSLLSGEAVKIDYNATQPRGGEITFEVLGRQGPGQVYVNVNGKTVWKHHLVSTGTPEIEIPRESLDAGMNSIVIGATQGGIFSRTEYKLEDLEVTVNDRKFHDWSDSFQLYSYEVEDFVSSQLTFTISDSVKTSPLEVYINDNLVYSKSQVRISPEKVDVTPQNADLHPGYNTIRFETDGQAKYSITNPQLTVRYLGNTEQQTVRMEFGINQSGLGFANRDDTEEFIAFDYQRLLPSPRPMVIELNDETYHVSPDNRTRIGIDADVLDRSNVLTVRSNATYEMNRLRVVSERVES